MIWPVSYKCVCNTHSQFVCQEIHRDFCIFVSHALRWNKYFYCMANAKLGCVSCDTSPNWAEVQSWLCASNHYQISCVILNQSNCDSEQIRLPQNSKWKGKKSRQNMMNSRLTYFVPHLPEQFNFSKNLRSPHKSISLCLFTCTASHQ